jgi:hypothetical protein
MGLKANSQEDIPDWLFYSFILFETLQLTVFLVLIYFVHTHV